MSNGYEIKGVKFPFQRWSKGAPAPAYDEDVISDSIKQIITTRQGERCFTGDTKVSLLDGRERTFKELLDEYGLDKDFWVYSFDIEKWKIVPGKARNLGIVEKNAEIIEVCLDNGEKVKCTPDHLWLMRDGNYKRADELKEGDSLLPLYRRDGKCGYEQFLKINKNSGKTKWVFTHFIMVLGEREEVIHHKDFNKKNNSPDNLEWWLKENHNNLHRKFAPQAFKEKVLSSPVEREKWINKIRDGNKKKWSDAGFAERRRKELGDRLRKTMLDNPELFNDLRSKNGKKFWHEEEFREKRECIARSLHEARARDLEKGDQSNTRLGIRKFWSSDNPDDIKKRENIIRSATETIKRINEEKRAVNHKVVAVNKVLEKQDVYCIKVPEYSSFALSAGVFVHNCMRPTFGTRIWEILFENDESLIQALAQKGFVDALTTWEPRISINTVGIRIEDNIVYIDVEYEYLGEPKTAQLSVGPLNF